MADDTPTLDPSIYGEHVDSGLEPGADQATGKGSVPVPQKEQLPQDAPTEETVQQEQAASVGRISPADITEQAAEQDYYPKILKDAEQYTNPYDKQIYIDRALRAARNAAALQIGIARRQQQFIVQQLNGILKTKMKNGLFPRTEQEIESMVPNFAQYVQQWKASVPDIEGRVAAGLYNNIKNDNMPTPERISRYQYYRGVALNRLQKPEDAHNFAMMNLDTMDLTDSQRKDLKDLQFRVSNGQFRDDRTKVILKDMDGLLRAAGVDNDPNNKAKRDLYDEFTGALTKKLEDMTAANQPLPYKLKDEHDLVMGMIKTYAGTYVPWRNDRLAFHTPPGRIADLLTQKYRKQFGAEIQSGKMSNDPNPWQMGWMYQQYLISPEGLQDADVNRP